MCVGVNTPCGDTAVCPQVTGVSPGSPELKLKPFSLNYLPRRLSVGEGPSQRREQQKRAANERKGDF